uniref:Uncharacterized protein n=1 Tax=Arundo donax TaxID=35708 RepID=A0A0A8YII5_ARUDO
MLLGSKVDGERIVTIFLSLQKAVQAFCYTEERTDCDTDFVFFGSFQT